MGAAILARLKNRRSQTAHRYGQYLNIGQNSASKNPVRLQRSISCSPHLGQAPMTFEIVILGIDATLTPRAVATFAGRKLLLVGDSRVRQIRQMDKVIFRRGASGWRRRNSAWVSTSAISNRDNGGVCFASGRHRVRADRPYAFNSPSDISRRHSRSAARSDASTVETTRTTMDEMLTEWCLRIRPREPRCS